MNHIANFLEHGFQIFITGKDNLSYLAPRNIEKAELEVLLNRLRANKDAIIAELSGNEPPRDVDDVTDVTDKANSVMDVTECNYSHSDGCDGCDGLYYSSQEKKYNKGNVFFSYRDNPNTHHTRHIHHHPTKSGYLNHHSTRHEPSQSANRFNSGSIQSVECENFLAAHPLPYRMWRKSPKDPWVCEICHPPVMDSKILEYVICQLCS